MAYAFSGVSADEPGWAVLTEATAAYRTAFGDRLVAACALGSLAHGGFAPTVSDVDLALVLDGRSPDDQATIDRVRQNLCARGGALHQRLSVFWSSLAALRENRDDGRFPAIDRLDLAENVKILHGEDITAKLPRPDRAQLLKESARFALAKLATDRVVGAFHQPAMLLDALVPLTRVVLLPVRFLHTTATGRLAATDEAVDRYLADPQPVAAELIRTTMRWRHGDPVNTARATALLNARLIPLYLHYIDSQLAELRKAGSDLAADFLAWRERLDSSE
ncbi:hypothetical protein [Streptantibioticus ferralitis]|uniref:Polymerase nucleotidyl transferase domain-containing protein n=1 Tax=Streptantibioticus ferralitis TaxID=236510 RepID=A0ABT5YUF6_9ACTN|nr:hypothetical protein [Streptantibioticus ferralitis]MDF2255093.1 hypothetical protein [Streptantibioticus ferralitis]